MDNANAPSPDTKDQTAEPPAPEVLKPRADESDGTSEGDNTPTPATSTAGKRPRRNYRPSHKATFIGLTVVVIVLVINAAIITFVLKGQSKGKGLGSQGEVSISQGVLDTIGVNRNAIGASGLELVQRHPGEQRASCAQKAE